MFPLFCVRQHEQEYANYVLILLDRLFWPAV